MNSRLDLDQLLDRVDSKYTMVVAAAKRARQITDGAEPMIETRATKPVTIALEELAANKLHYQRAKEGIK